MEEIWKEADNELVGNIQQIFVSTEALQKRVREIGQAISQDYKGKNPVLVGALKGVVLFMSDLLRAVTIPVEVDFIAVSSYNN